MSTNRTTRARGSRREPSTLDGLFAGRSRADREAEQDAYQRALAIVGAGAVLTVVLVRAAFRAAGLAFEWWSVLAFVPLVVWLLASAGAQRALRPRELDELRWYERLLGFVVALAAMRLCWPRWAEPVVRAWRHAHGGWKGPGDGWIRFPLRSVLEAAPVWLGVVAFLLLAAAMLAAPRSGADDREGRVATLPEQDRAWDSVDARRWP